MAGKTPAEAVQNYIDPLRRALSCVTDSVLQVGGGYHPANNPHSLVLARGDPVPLRGDEKISLSLSQRYNIISEPDDKERGPWKVSTAAYYYTLEDDCRNEIIAFHWHPFVGFEAPHLHLMDGAGVQRHELRGAHLPTGRTAIEQVLYFAINEFGVVPIREDWDDVLKETLARFERYRTWGTTPPAAGASPRA